MNIHAVKTHRIQNGESLSQILDRYIHKLKNGSVVAITSKIVSLCQGRVVSKQADPDFKKALIKQEADAVIDTVHNPYGIYLTLKNNILIPSAGIDESNGDNVYILYPENIQETALTAWSFLAEKHGIPNLGVIITDSHTMPLRRGVTGIALGWCGFKPLYSYIGKPDIYGNPLRVTQINLLDALATSAVLMMGEGSEQSPLAIIVNAPKIDFLDRAPIPEEESSVSIPIEEDLYRSLLLGQIWIANPKKTEKT